MRLICYKQRSEAVRRGPNLFFGIASAFHFGFFKNLISFLIVYIIKLTFKRSYLVFSALVLVWSCQYLFQDAFLEVSAFFFIQDFFKFLRHQEAFHLTTPIQQMIFCKAYAHRFIFCPQALKAQAFYCQPKWRIFGWVSLFDLVQDPVSRIYHGKTSSSHGSCLRLSFLYR